MENMVKYGSDGVVNSAEVPAAAHKYVTYHRRWYLLASLAVLALSNGMMWLTYAPIPSRTADFYDITVSQVDLFSICYFVVSLIVGFIAIWLIERAGLRFAVMLGALLNLVGASLRVVSTISGLRHSEGNYAFVVALTGQVFTAIAQPFFLYSPTKLSFTWFSEKQRAVATMVTSMANPIGIGVIYVIAPRIVNDDPAHQIPTLLWICAISAAIGFGLSLMWLLLGSKPPTPPGPCADDIKVPFLRGLKEVMCNRSFWWLIIIWGAGSGLFNGLLTLLPQFLCTYGYSEMYSGTWGGVLVFVGLVGAFVSGVIIDVTKNFEGVAKVMCAFALICFIWFLEVFSLEDEPVLIAFSLCSFGFFGFALMPVCLELGVELTYPVAEATSSGLLWSATQLMGLFLTTVGEVMERDVSEEQKDRSKCYGNIKPKDLTYTGLFFAAIGVAGYLLLVIGLRHPVYKRLQAEKSGTSSTTNGATSSTTNRADNPT
ncbi:solute carrier family 49 member A3-like isoform X2 [Dysidea avara]|uniref:solute carrier family 49 member A3-like isoform X2 n=1 Tax=Dysidea avara TaxID=196820 RepID=UPI00332CA0F3